MVLLVLTDEAREPLEVDFTSENTLQTITDLVSTVDHVAKVDSSDLVEQRMVTKRESKDTQAESEVCTYDDCYTSNSN